MQQVNSETREIPAPVRKIVEDLQKGNGRFVIGMRIGNLTETRRYEVAETQHPSATILACSDSRVAPEFLFDRGLGEIYVVRASGNVAIGVTLGSLEHGCDQLGTPLLLVLGHTQCGAVTAVCTGQPLPPHLQKVTTQLQPLVDAVIKERNLKPKDLVTYVVRAHVENLVKQLPQKSEVLRKLVQAGKLTILGGIYHLDSGEVEFLCKL